MKKRLKSIFGGSSLSLNGIEENSHSRPYSSPFSGNRSPTLCMLESQNGKRLNVEEYSQHDTIKRKYISASDSVCLHTSSVDLDDLFDTVFDDEAEHLETEHKSASSQIKLKPSPISGSLRSLTLPPFPWFPRSSRSSSTRKEEIDNNQNLPNNGILSEQETFKNSQDLHTQSESPTSNNKAFLGRPECYKEEILFTYQLLYKMTILKPKNSPLELKHLSRFYVILHQTLCSSDQDLVNKILRSSCQFFSSCLPASHLLLLDFIHACRSITASFDLKAPRSEVQTILRSALCFSNIHHNAFVLTPDCQKLDAVECNKLKDAVIEILLTSARKEPSSTARCVALASTGMWLYEELTSQHKKHCRVKEAINILLVSLNSTRPKVSDELVESETNLLLGRLPVYKFHNHLIAKVACSQLHLLTHCSSEMMKVMPGMTLTVIEVISLTISLLLSISEAETTQSRKKLNEVDRKARKPTFVSTFRSITKCPAKDISIFYCLSKHSYVLSKGVEPDPSSVGLCQRVNSKANLIISLLFCLLDWCMVVPKRVLTDAVGAQSKRRVITTVLKTLQRAVSGKQNHRYVETLDLSDLASEDFDPDLPLENMQDALPTGISAFSKVSSNKSEAKSQRSNKVRLAASTVLGHLTNHLGHFPLTQDPSAVTSRVSEYHDVTDVVHDLDPSLFNSRDAQFLICNDSCLLSVLEIPAEKEKSFSDASLKTSLRSVRFIVRNISGKHCWESTMLHEPQDITVSHPCVHFKTASGLHEPKHHLENDLSTCVKSTQVTEPAKSYITTSSMPHQLTDLPENSCDKLDQLLRYIRWSSPECEISPKLPLNVPPGVPVGLSVDAQSAAIKRMSEYNENLASTCQKKAPFVGWRESAFRCQKNLDFHTTFHEARLFCSKLDFLSFDEGHQMSLLKKNESLLRELKNLDSRRCRETHKVAVFYIAEGQEDKLSILSNTKGSKEYEEFVAGLGWEVDLTNHNGFRGKLQSDGSNGATAPYYATSTIEVIYHVATRFPSLNEAAKNVKIRHLGNDEVHIVWSEHHRDYRRGIIPTEFGDVLIVIYPIHFGLFRIQIIKKPEIPYFGPLFNGAVVTARALPVLVRETAINGGRAKRSLINLYQAFYEERSKYLHQIITKFKDKKSFEQLSAHFLSPCPITKKEKKKQKSSGKSMELSIIVTSTASSLPNTPSFGNTNNNNNSTKSVSKSPRNDVSQGLANTLQVPSRRKHLDVQRKSPSTVSSFSKRFFSSPALHQDSQTSPTWGEGRSPFQNSPFFIFPNLSSVTSSSNKITTKHH